MTSSFVILQIKEVRTLQKAFFASKGKATEQQRKELMRIADDKLSEVEKLVSDLYEIPVFESLTNDERLILQAFNRMKVSQWQFFATKSSAILAKALSNEAVLDTLLKKYFLESNTAPQIKLF